MTRLISRLIVGLAFAQPAFAAGEAGWAYYGGDAGGMRYSPAPQITPENVDQLIRAWTYRTGELETRSPEILRQMKWQTTPVLQGDSLYLCTPFNVVIALNPGTGVEKWRFDPKIATENVRPANRFNCRGVAVWTDSAAPPLSACAVRVFTGTTDGRLISLDAKTGRPCADFGTRGEIKITPSIPLLWPGEYQISSAPVVVSGTVVVGSAIGDNQRAAAPFGTVHAFDTRTGAVKWTFDPIPRDAKDARAPTWGDGWKDTGHANVWAPMSVDEGRGLIFMPTSSPSPDFFGGLRPGDNRHADSVVAVEADTGAVRWAYQIVHHDVWDYDLPAQPTLATLKFDSRPRDVVIQGTKQGLIFVLDRDTGAPVFPVEEHPVPQGAVAGEALSPTQPFPTHLPALAPSKLTPDEAFGLTPWDRSSCNALINKVRSEGLYTPPSEQGTILFPFTGGGINWGGVAFDPERQILFANTSRIAHLITLFKSAEFERLHKQFPDREISPQKGSPFGMIRDAVLGSPVPLPCNPPPWGVLAAVDLKAGKIIWETTLGTLEEYTGGLLALPWGTPNLGGPIVTKGGVLFIGAAMDRYLRAFDVGTGRELWQGRLPATAQATPITYEWQGKQFVVIAAGGYPDAGVVAPNDTLVAFRLPQAGEAGPSLWSRTIDRPGGRGRAALTFSMLVLAGLLFGLWHWRRRRACPIRKRPPTPEPEL